MDTITESAYNNMKTGVQAVIDKHSRTESGTSNDPWWDRHAICSQDGQMYPCEVRRSLQDVLKNS